MCIPGLPVISTTIRLMRIMVMSFPSMNAFEMIAVWLRKRICSLSWMVTSWMVLVSQHIHQNILLPYWKKCHELYRNSTIEYITQPDGFVDFWQGRYLTSNALLVETGEPIGNRYIFLQGQFSEKTILVFGFLYDFSHHGSGGRRNSGKRQLVPRRVPWKNNSNRRRKLWCHYCSSAWSPCRCPPCQDQIYLWRWNARATYHEAYSSTEIQPSILHQYHSRMLIMPFCLNMRSLMVT